MKTKFKGIIVCLLGIIGLLIPEVLMGQIVASRVEGVAPLLVHFEATCSPDQFHHSLFRWNFGDEMSPLWGTDMKNQVFAEGPVTAHLFEQPGFYEVTLVKKNDDGWASFYTIEIYAYDPDIVYEGNLTVCVNPANDTDFSESPSGSLHISTDSIKNITQYAMPGQRILFKRGGVWSISSTLNWPQNSGPVVIGAYGTGVNPDPMGIYQNNPQIIVNGGNFLPMDFKQNWTIMDITLRDPSQLNGSFGGAESFHHWLFFHVKVDGFEIPIGWSTWNDPLGNTHVDHMGIISCVFENAAVNVGYIGSERLMVMGSIFRNANESHVLRVWQCYKGVLAHNQISGSSLNTNTGRHALKFHGPSEAQIATTEWSHLNKRTQYSVISDNVFGTSGPWPVMVAPQDDWSDERLSHIIFERNQYFSDFGNSSTLSLQPSVICSFNGTNLTIRNNIIDASAYGAYFTGILVKKNTVAPAPENVEIYHNTIYKYADPNGQIWNGIEVLDTCGAITIRNNLVEFPYVCAGHFSVYNLSPNTEYSNNVLNSTITFEDPDHTDPLQRSFRLHQNSLSAIDMGYVVSSVHLDFDGNTRPLGNGYDIGAFEFIPPVSIEGFNDNDILFPNPTTGMVYLKSEVSIQDLKIFDMKGKLMNQFTDAHQINLTQYPSGLYLVTWRTVDGTISTQKLVISH